jgi:hypothetical protein
MQVCAGAATPNPEYPACLALPVKNCTPTLPGAGLTPLHVWYNASKPPTMCVARGSTCTASGGMNCCPGDWCANTDGAQCQGGLCTCQAAPIIF